MPADLVVKQLASQSQSSGNLSLVTAPPTITATVTPSGSALQGSVAFLY